MKITVPNFDEMRENARKDLFERMELARPKSKWNTLVESAEASITNNRLGLDLFFGIAAFVVGIVLVLLKPDGITFWVGFGATIIGAAILLKEAVSIAKIVKEYKDMEQLLPAWQAASYEDCVKYAMEYKDNEWACLPVNNFLYNNKVIEGIRKIANAEILEIYADNSTNIITINYADKDGMVQEYTAFDSKIKRSTAITEPKLEVIDFTFVYTIPYKK